MVAVDLSGKKALVTGASRGIGREIAKRLSDAGAFVYVNYRSSEEAARSLVSEINGELLRFDVGNLDEVERALKGISVDILVNNAGVAEDALLLRLKRDSLERVISVNLLGAIWVTKMVLRGMLKKRWGRIVNVSSVVGLSGNPGQVAYAASKAGLVAFTKSLAKELSGRGVTVNCVAPGFIKTDMTSGFSEEDERTLVSQIPLGRAGSPREVADVVVFLASELASYITGEVVNVSGGLYM